LIEEEIPPVYKKYFKELNDKVKDLYEIAKKARSKGLDPETKPEPKITRDIAERIEKLIGPE
jgi:DNA polymerase II large subunit